MRLLNGYNLLADVAPVSLFFKSLELNYLHLSFFSFNLYYLYVTVMECWHSGFKYILAFSSLFFPQLKVVVYSLLYLYNVHGCIL